MTSHYARTAAAGGIATPPRMFPQVAALFAVGLILPLAAIAWVTAAGIPFAGGIYESHEYVEPALGLLEAGKFARNVGGVYVPELVRLPGYPVFIATVYGLFGVGNDLAVALAQAGLVGLTVVAVGVAAAAIDRRWMWPAALFVALAANVGYRASIVLPEPLFALQVAGSVGGLLWALYGPRVWLPLGISALFTAAGFVTRPAFLLFPFFIAPVLWLALWRGKRMPAVAALAAALLPALASVAVAVPRVVTVHEYTGHYALTTQGGGHALFWTYPCLVAKWGCGERAPAALAVAEQRGQQELEAAPAAVRADRAAVDALLRAAARDLILDLPVGQLAAASVGAFLKMMLHTVVYAHYERLGCQAVYWSQVAGENVLERLWNFVADLIKRPPMWLWVFAQVSLFAARLVQVAGLISALRSPRHRLPALVLVAGAAAFAVVAVSIGNPRYRIPIEPILAIFGAFGVAAGLRWMNARVRAAASR